MVNRGGFPFSESTEASPGTSPRALVLDPGEARMI